MNEAIKTKKAGKGVQKRNQSNGNNPKRRNKAKKNTIK